MKGSWNKIGKETIKDCLMILLLVVGIVLLIVII